MTPLTLERKIQKLPPKLHVIKDSLVEIGSILKEARLKWRLNVKDIREKTCIPIHHILAIEAGVREELPEDFFLISFIKKYARAVGLNEEVLCEKYLVSKTKSPNYETEAFDLLFQKHHEETRPIFIKVYHFYFFIGLCLFAIACYLMIQFNSNPPSKYMAANEKIVNIASEDSMQIPEVSFTEVKNEPAKEQRKTQQAVQKPVVKVKIQKITSKQIAQVKTNPHAALMLRPAVVVKN